jgi:hypothetical protein
MNSELYYRTSSELLLQGWGLNKEDQRSLHKEITRPVKGLRHLCFLHVYIQVVWPFWFIWNQGHLIPMN